MWQFKKYFLNYLLSDSHASPMKAGRRGAVSPSEGYGHSSDTWSEAELGSVWVYWTSITLVSVGILTMAANRIPFWGPSPWIMILQEPAHLTKYKQAKLISYFGPWPQLQDGRRPASSSYFPLGSPIRPFLTRWCAMLRGHWEGITIWSKQWEICPWAATPLLLLWVVTQTATGLNCPNANSLHINIITDLRIWI